MPYIPHTPEALLPRSDSRNPATTCRGLTANGRPCRRSLAASLAAVQDGATSVVGAVSPVAPSTAEKSSDLALAALYCWQHKEQAKSTAPAGARLISLQNRTSIDTLVDRLGILDLDEPCREKDNKTRHRSSRGNARPHDAGRDLQKRPKLSFFALLCCMGSPNDADMDYVEIIRHRKRTEGNATAEMAAKPMVVDGGRYRQSNRDPFQPRPHQPRDRNPSMKGDAYQSSRPPIQPMSYLYGYVPSTLPPQIASRLLAEASKPMSELDEDGYIYMFWLTDGAAPSPTHTSSLLDHSFTSQLSAAGSPARAPLGPHDKILVKIGRTTNVQRRLSSWSRQCGYNLSLVRFYPYTPSTAPSPVSSTSPNRDMSAMHAKIPQAPPIQGRMVPHSHRVERLIHIELSDKRMKDVKCAVCGKEHQEWFEVKASREGLRAIDGVIRRWVSWAEGVHPST